MKKVLGLVFALALFFLPIAWGVHAEDTISADQGSASVDASSQSGPVSFFRDFILKHFMGKQEDAQLDKANADNAKSKLSGLRSKIEEFLKKLNNTSL
jgi:hypothetical protein